jgi:TM2 domain-containing membrane protein YozV
MLFQPTRPLSRARAVSCLLVNLAATPGLGSLLARRIFAGIGQLLLALAGFGLIVVWMFELFLHMTYQQLGEPVLPRVHDGMLRWGLICFIASWLWSLATSISLLRQAKNDEAAGPKPVPPPLANLPGEMPKPQP